MITADQIKTARKMLGWTAEQLAAASSLSRGFVGRAETGKLVSTGSIVMLRQIEAALVEVGIEFTDDDQGVRLRNAP